MIQKFKILKKYHTSLSNSKFELSNNGTLLLENFPLLKKPIKISKSNNKLYKVLQDILQNYKYNFSNKILIQELENYQINNNYQFSYNDLYSVKNILEYIFIEKLLILYKEEAANQINKEKIIEFTNKESLTINEMFPDDFNYFKSSYYIYQLNNKLSGKGAKNNKLFKELIEFLKTKNISLKEVVNNQRKKNNDNNLFINQLFLNIKELINLEEEELLKVSNCEKKLLEYKIYRNSTVNTKKLYREKIIKKAKLKEFDYINKLLKNNDFKDVLIISNKRVIFIISNIIVLIISAFFSYILNTLLLFIPIVFLLYLTLFLTNKRKTINLATYEIDNNEDIMTILPISIIKEEDILEKVKYLEKLFLLNNKSNIHFLLVVEENVSLSSKRIIEQLKDSINNLNEKYNTDNFHTIYLKGDNKDNFTLINNIITNNITKSDKTKCVNYISFKKMKYNIKYGVIINSFIEELSFINKLYKIISHPINKPILNKNNTKVVKGYAAVIPNIKSSKIIKLFSYNREIQKLYEEVSYNDIGIYNVEVYKEISNNKKSNNLLNTNKLRIGYTDQIKINNINKKINIIKNNYIHLYKLYLNTLFILLMINFLFIIFYIIKQDISIYYSIIILVNLSLIYINKKQFIKKQKKHNKKNVSLKKSITYKSVDIKKIPNIFLLSNNNLTSIINEKGNNYLKYKNIDLTRHNQVENIEYGQFIYIKDIEDNKIVSTTYAPFKEDSSKYLYAYENNKVKFLYDDNDLNIITEIIIGEEDIEFKKITLINKSQTKKAYEIAVSTQVSLTEYMNELLNKKKVYFDVSFKTKIDTLIINPRKKDNMISMFNKILLDKPISSYNYSFDNENEVIVDNKIELEKNEETVFYVLNGVVKNTQNINDIIKKYNRSKCSEEFIKNDINKPKINKLANDLHTYMYNSYNIKLDDKVNQNIDIINCNLSKLDMDLNQQTVILEISSEKNLDFILDILKCFEYLKNNLIYINVLIINNADINKKQVINKEIEEQLFRMYNLNSFYHTKGEVKVIDYEDINYDELNLLNILSTIYFKVLEEDKLQDKLTELLNSELNDFNVDKQPLFMKKKKLILEYDNGYGGFKNNGEEYVIYNNELPDKWENILYNKEITSVVSNDFNSSTYLNENEYNITKTSTLNDALNTEGIIINNKLFNPSVCIHGLGYSVYKSNFDNIETEVTQFIPVNDKVKVSILKIKSKNIINDIDIKFFIKPTLGSIYEKNNKIIKTYYSEENNYIKMINLLDNSNKNTYLASSQKINNIDILNKNIKTITNNISISKEEKTIIYMMGLEDNCNNINYIVDKYSNIDNVETELANVYCNFINNRDITVKTEDNSFDYMVNNWYLNQSIAFNNQKYKTKDKLINSLNLISYNKNICKDTILEVASKQFIEGDILGEFSSNTTLGLRTKNKGDILLFVNTIIEYIKYTDNYKIIDEKVHFITGNELSKYEDEKIVIYQKSNNDTILNHIFKSLDLVFENIEDLPLFGTGDISDNYNYVGNRLKGKSVILGFMSIKIIEDLNHILKKYNINKNMSSYNKIIKNIKKFINTNTYKNKHFIRGYYDNGDTLGASTNLEGKIDLNTQLYALTSNAVSVKRKEEILESINTLNNNNLIKDIYPYFNETINYPGRVMDYLPGELENGSQMNSSIALYIKSLIKLNKVDLAYEYFHINNPVNKSSKDNILLYKKEPYILAKSINTKNLEQKAKSGVNDISSSEFYSIAITNILGITIKEDLLIINPKVPSTWNKYKITYNYKDTKYIIKFIRNNNISSNYNEIKLKNSIEIQQVIIEFK